MFDFIKNEEEVLHYWIDNDINKKIRAANKGNKAFYFLDGPPYASGNLHPGQIWVKSIKDILVRYRRMCSYDVHDRAGYDVHGLPIENKVEKTLGLNSKKEIELKIGIDNFIKYCTEYANSLIPNMTKDFVRFGASLDFDNPYLAYKDSFIERAWGILKTANEKGFLYSGSKPMLYCTHCGTVLAQGTLEIEYSDESDTSLFVEFQVNKKDSKPRIDITDKTYLLIWTTTPWTLPSNISVAVNPKERYVKLKLGEKSLILMKSRLDHILDLIDENAVIEAEFFGSELEGIFYINPLEEKIKKQEELRKFHKVLMAEELVSSSEGSGIVHIAPGHGVEDYALGKANSLPIFSTVDLSGKYNSDAGSFFGLSVPLDANVAILEELKKNDFLLATTKIKHSYPHCWRCKEKLLFLVTTQWFFNIQKIKNKLISENKKVAWHPAEGKQWMEDVLSNSPDWSIARQRYWGIPIPIWQCDSCNSIKVIGSKEELISSSVDSVIASNLTNLHRPYIDTVKIKCEKCGGNSTRVTDVFDVWFDSGIAFKASLSDDEFNSLFPADFILEGKDQLRGWFSTLLKIGVILYGKAPFKNVIIDGMLLAEDGREMHKSLGNYLSIDELLKITSADSYRLWCSSHTQWLDIQFKKDEIRESEKKISTIYNMFNLMDEYFLAIEYSPSKIKKPNMKNITEISDKWILSRLSTTMKLVSEALERYDVQTANALLSDFSLNDLSRLYLKLLKKRIIYGDKKQAKTVLDILNYVLYNLIIMMAPFTPFTSEYLYLKNYKNYAENLESIFLIKWPRANKKMIDASLESEFSVSNEVITAILNSRERSGIKLRWPLSKATIETTSEELTTSISKFYGIITEYTNIKTLEIKKVESMGKDIKPNFSTIGPDFKDKSNAVSEAIRSIDANELISSISKKGIYSLHTSKGVLDINSNHFTIIEKVQKENGVPFKYGLVYVDKEIDKKLREEALIREFERRVQLLRKDMNLKKPDVVDIYFTAPKELSEAILSNKEQVLHYINARKIEPSLSNQESLPSKEFDIDGETLVLQIIKL